MGLPGTASTGVPCELDRAGIARLPHPAFDPTATREAYARALADTRRWDPRQLPPMTTGNAVVPYVYGRCAFADMADALFTAVGADDRVYLLGWWVTPWVVLKDGTPPLRLSDYLAITKAQVRGMFWDDPGGTALGPTKKVADNGPIVKLLNGMPNGAAVLDHKLPFLRYAGTRTGIRGGVHHQKLLVVKGRRGLVAFTGGMDLNDSRVQVSHGGFEPLHDVHVRIAGPAAGHLLEVFEQRWLDHPDTAALDQQHFQKSPAEVRADFESAARAPSAAIPTFPADPSPPSLHAVNVGRTFCNLRKFNGNEEYGFARQGDRSAWGVVSSAITHARQYLYLEDQYFVSRRVKRALVAKLADPQFRFLLVLCHASSDFEPSATLLDDEFPYLIAARNEIRAELSAVDPRRQRWRMFSLKASADPQRQEWCGSYVHSKIVIADDDFAVIGTANMDDRGYTLDTEIVAGITEDPMGRATGRRFARDLRVALWHKHLGVPYARVADWAGGLPLWLTPPATAMIRDASAPENSPLLGPTPLLSSDAAAQRLWSEDIDPDADLLP